MPATPSFSAHIRPLFRDDDIAAMEDWFDLSSYDHVKENADLILERIEDGTIAVRRRLVGRADRALPRLEGRGIRWVGPEGTE